MRINHASRTHPGTTRPVNEDASVERPQAGLWAVADGMGGHVGGRWCARTIADALEQAALPDMLETAAQAVSDALEEANRSISDTARRVGSPMGSTVAALLLRDRRFAILWAGDSRVYHGRNGRLRQVTTDHSQVERLAAQGLLDRSEIASHPLRHVLARTVGSAERLSLDRVDGTIEPGDSFLLCSDGLSCLVDLPEMERAIAQSPPGEAAAALLHRALERGAQDNVTVTVLCCEEATQIGGYPSGD